MNAEPVVSGLAARLAQICEAGKLYYPDSLLRGIEAGLATPNRFLIFYGPPGAGKSRLVEAIASALPAELRSVPVQTDWADAGPLIGAYDAAHGVFLPGALVSLIQKASASPDRLFVFCLEEMALGDPEGYLATLLEAFDASPPALHLDLPAASVPGGGGTVSSARLPLPPNLLFFGTLYLPEKTGRLLPRKLLDRSLLIELELANLQQFLAVWDRPFPGKEALVKVFEILENHRIRVGYRVFREISATLTKAAAVGLSLDALLDVQMKARLLPVIAGDAATVEDCLQDLVRFWSAAEINFPETLDKAVRMLEELGLHGRTAAYYS